MPAAVVMRGITRRFGAVVANDGIDFDLAAGEIHGLLGQNGSGKTTLMSILYGLVRPDAGSIAVGGHEVHLRGPADGLRAGVALIPQRFRLVPTLSVAENVALGLEPHGRRQPRMLREVSGRLLELAARYGLGVEPQAQVESLSMGERQRVEILRALYHDSRVLLMDEPTSVLTPGEVEQLFAMVRGMVEREGRTVVLVTHKLREVVGLAHRMTVLRAGRKAATFDAAEATPARLVEAMMGERAGFATPTTRSAAAADSVVVEVKNLSLSIDPAEALVHRELRGVSFAVKAGEVYGIAGVEGNGQWELELVLAGLLAPDSGEVRVLGRPGVPRDRIGYIPSDRDQWGVIRDLTVAENLLLRRAAAGRAVHAAPARRPAALAEVAQAIERYRVVPPDPALRAGGLSGGTAQKLLLARELADRPALIVAAQPTAGLDIASAAFVRAEMRRAADNGAAVVVISSDLDELLELADRIGVMYGGALRGEWPAASATARELGAAMAGA
ncbi:MAG: ABC transporter ATP-binding protein [Betaproteobacteria bacterium]